jgi:hypothetical protein
VGGRGVLFEMLVIVQCVMYCARASGVARHHS